MADTTWPFSPARVFARPTADQIWLGPTQRSVLGRLAEAPGSAVRLLVGPRSCGKTTLLEHWIARFDPSVVLSSRGTELDAAALLASLLRSAGFGPWGLSEIDQRNLLTLFVRQRFMQGRKIVVTIERADRLGLSAMQELDRIGGILVDGEPALQIYLCGSGRLHDRIRSTAGGWLASHWYACAVEAVSPADAADYIRWRFERSGLSENLFTAAATEFVAHLSEGRFSSINMLCQMALVLLRANGAECVDATLVQRASDELMRRAGERRAAKTSRLDAREASGYLLVTQGGDVVAQVPLQTKLLFGSAADCDLQLSSGPARRYHGVIVRTRDGYDVIELPGGHSLVLNGRRITRAKLVDHDLIAVGPYRLRYHAPRLGGQAVGLRPPSEFAPTHCPQLRLIK